MKRPILSSILALSRIAVGAAVFIAPRMMQRVNGKSRDPELVDMLTRGMGIRDAAIGTALLFAAGANERRRLLLSAAAVDMGDMLSTTLAWSRFGRRVRWVLLASEVAGAVGEIAALVLRERGALVRPSPPPPLHASHF